MIKVDISGGRPEPVWHDVVPGVRIKATAVDTFMLNLASARARGRVADALPDRGVIEDATEENAEDRQTHHVIEVAKLAIVDWEGVCDEGGAPVAVTPDAVGVVLGSVITAYLAFYNKVYLPAFSAHVVREDEKNG